MVPNGYDHNVIIRWGDEVVPGAADFDPAEQTGASQSKQFGYNNDFVAVLPLRQGARNPPEYAGRAVAEQQRAAYPDLQPLVLAIPVAEALARAQRIAAANGWHVVAADPFPDAGLQQLGVRYAPIPEVIATADVLSLNCPLTAATHHLIDAAAISTMKRGAMLVNTGRGALVDTAAVVEGLKTGQIGSLAIDVYEEEGSLFFEDRSDQIITDDVFARLLVFPNVLVTAHQAFFTHEALAAIAATTLANLDDVEAGRPCPNEVRA